MRKIYVYVFTTSLLSNTPKLNRDLFHENWQGKRERERIYEISILTHILLRDLSNKIFSPT